MCTEEIVQVILGARVMLIESAISESLICIVKEEVKDVQTGQKVQFVAKAKKDALARSGNEAIIPNTLSVIAEWHECITEFLVTRNPASLRSICQKLQALYQTSKDLLSPSEYRTLDYIKHDLDQVQVHVDNPDVSLYLDTQYIGY